MQLLSTLIQIISKAFRQLFSVLLHTSGLLLELKDLNNLKETQRYVVILGGGGVELKWCSCTLN